MLFGELGALNVLQARPDKLVDYLSHVLVGDRILMICKPSTSPRKCLKGGHQPLCQGTPFDCDSGG